MQIVIDIPKGCYEEICTASFPVQDAYRLVAWIKEGAVLPEKHGKLVDVSEIHKAIPAEEDNITGAGMIYEEMDAYNDGINTMFSIIQGATPILEATECGDKK